MQAHLEMVCALSISKEEVMTTTQKASRRNFLRGWWLLHVNVPCIQAELAVDADKTSPHQGSDEAWKSSTRKNALLARLAVHTSWNMPLTDVPGSLCRRQ